jgi:hypothetical protein
MAEGGLVRRQIFYVVLGLAFVNGLSHVPATAQKKPDTTTWKYNGPGSCAASACHGGVQPVGEAKTRKGIWQNEYFIWASRDPHFGSFNTLQSERSRQMAKILKLKNSPTSEPMCLTCHALAPAEQSKARPFAVEGVSCENCHGPSSGWFQKHFEEKGTTAQSIQNGMKPIDDLVERSEICLSCHLGTKPGQEVDHKMIAAGHPDLFFEVDLFSAKEPRHWAEPPDWTAPPKRTEPGPWGDSTHDRNYRVRLWAVGQAIQLREALNRLARRAERAQAPDFLAKGGQWPEFSELDCFSCHHSVRSNWPQPAYEDRTAGLPSKPSDSWRQKNGYDDRIAGAPPWNRAHYTIFLILMKEVDPNESAELEARLDRLFKVASKLNSSPQEVKSKADEAVELASRVVSKVNKPFDRPTLGRLLLKISAQGKDIAQQDTRSAEQAYMALDSLFRCYDSKINNKSDVKNRVRTGEAALNTGEFPGVGKAIDKLYNQFDNPSAYNAMVFATGMAEVHAELRKAGIGSR